MAGWMRWHLVGIALVAAACTSPHRSGAVGNTSRVELDFVKLLDEVGRDGPDSDALASAYVRHGSRALLAATQVLLEPTANPSAERGARIVLQSLGKPEDFAFVTELKPTQSPRHSCAMGEILFLLGNSAQFMEPDWDKRPHRLVMVPVFARRLVALLDEPWSTCVKTAPGSEPGYTHPHVVALELLNDMVGWSSDFDGSLAKIWESAGPETIRDFKTWWLAHPLR
jgi:hypothetical protein